MRIKKEVSEKTNQPTNQSINQSINHIDIEDIKYQVAKKKKQKKQLILKHLNNEWIYTIYVFEYKE